MTTDERFEIFWEAYPRKQAKKTAKKAWDKVKPNDELTWKIVDSIKEQTQSKSWQDGYIPHPSTWLTQGRWEDEEIKPIPKVQNTPKVKSQSFWKLIGCDSEIDYIKQYKMSWMDLQDWMEKNPTMARRGLNYTKHLGKPEWFHKAKGYLEDFDPPF